MDEEKKREEDEVSEQELDEVSGGITGPSGPGEVSLVKEWDLATPELADQVSTGGVIDPIKIDFVSTEDEDD
jgi:type VI protein secretion system component Hcp